MNDYCLKQVWKTVICWCRFCWWKQSGEFYALTATEQAIRRRFHQKHKSENPKCRGDLQIVNR